LLVSAEQQQFDVSALLLLLSLEHTNHDHDMTVTAKKKFPGRKTSAVTRE
jgi:hypothetical protein